MISDTYMKLVMIATVVLVSVVFLSVVPVHASDTMLMFVGEDLDVLSIASRKEESAWSAPAIAKVITNEDLSESGALTITEAIDDVAGFHVEKTNKGSIPYLRGIPNSALVLYDTVPIGSGADKSDHLIDYENSLASIKRIEIIRGAGSVLWGPDAFAGVINAVPFTGRDFSGVETGLALSSADQGKQAYVRYGASKGAWSSFFCVSARQATEDDTPVNVISFWNDGINPTPAEERFGSSTPDDSQYVDLYGNVSFSDWLVISAKLSDGQKAFSVTDWDREYIWEEQKSYGSKMFKLEASKDISIDSGIRFAVYYSDIGLEKTFIDRQFDQNEYSVFGELIYEKSLFSSDALLTVGTSYKEDHFKDILVWNSFYPGFLVPENQGFLPDFSQKDYENTLFSVFGQYRHKIQDIEFWAGFRNDDHEKFEDKVSFSSGIAWELSSELMVKAIYGSGYRTPFAKQVDTITENCLEQINNINLQLQYKPNPKTLFSITVFRNDIKDHVVGDRYEGAGVSLSNSQTIDGIELEWEFAATQSLSFSGNATFLDNDGTYETFLSYEHISYPDYYPVLHHSYDTGSDIMFNLSGVWQMAEHIKLVSQIEYFSGRELYYSMDDETRKYPDAWLCNLRLRFEDVNSWDIDLFVNNVFSNKYKTFDAASDHSSESVSAGITLKYKW
ncbi:TonB-dependent receptor plug domain-containing protein [Desulfobacula phenolica]|uniref:Outer membrane cobalamin receptor protein n=1 Tax=Desulfobacula phenolica TaxID=90732 RepID=A0A1H2DP86_9BACT|nr:TonB-dependent receptor [Desulfobacula phenolica]SDT84626.1 Outer membrane cobalamin receptor protein [Desulfobacula phenolica]